MSIPAEYGQLDRHNAAGRHEFGAWNRSGTGGFQEPPSLLLDVRRWLQPFRGLLRNFGPTNQLRRLPTRLSCAARKAYSIRAGYENEWTNWPLARFRAPARASIDSLAPAASPQGRETLVAHFLECWLFVLRGKASGANMGITHFYDVHNQVRLCSGRLEGQFPAYSEHRFAMGVRWAAERDQVGDGLTQCLALTGWFPQCRRSNYALAAALTRIP